MTKIQTMLKDLSNDCEQLTANLVTKKLFEAVEKKVTVKIAQKDQEFLHNSDYYLCFAKKVGDKYTVVWRSFDRENYGPENEFSWIPKYEVFWTNKFESNVTVKVNSGKRKIGLGEITTIDKLGYFSQTKTGGDLNSLNIINNRGRLHLGVCQLSDGGSTPIYVAPQPMEEGEAMLTPVEKVKVWFQQDIQTSTMISNITTNSCEVDLTEDNEYQLTYEKGKWLHQ